MTFKVSDQFEQGAILVDQWGWEQTNIDFYVILERKGDFVKVQKLKKQTSEEVGFMTNYEMPIFELDKSERPIRKKVYKSKESYQLGKELGFSFRNYAGGGWCSLWKGQKETSTHYA